MKVLNRLAILTLVFISSSVFAHSGGHGEVDESRAIEVAQTSAKLLTFKDHGMSVGKIDNSWNNVTKQQFEVIEVNDSNFMVEAVNDKTKESLIFLISKSGELEDVKSVK